MKELMKAEGEGPPISKRVTEGVVETEAPN